LPSSPLSVFSDAVFGIPLERVVVNAPPSDASSAKLQPDANEQRDYRICLTLFFVATTFFGPFRVRAFVFDR
jgi:hypothetical protein